MPAVVEGRHFDVLAANALATALSPRLAPGANRLRDLFLDPAEQDLYPDWENAAGGMVAGFRRSVGTDTDHPRCVELVGELSLAGPRFGRLWARHDVEACEGAPKYIDHPQVGRLRLNRERLGIGGTAGQTLVIYHPDPGTDERRRTGTPRVRHAVTGRPRGTTAGEQALFSRGEGRAAGTVKVPILGRRRE